MATRALDRAATEASSGPGTREEPRRRRWTGGLAAIALLGATAWWLAAGMSEPHLSGYGLRNAQMHGVQYASLHGGSTDYLLYEPSAPLGVHLDLHTEGPWDVTVLDVDVRPSGFDCAAWQLDFDGATVLDDELQPTDRAPVIRSDGWLRLQIPGATAPASCDLGADSNGSLTYQTSHIAVRYRVLGRTFEKSLEAFSRTQLVFDESQLDEVRAHDPVTELLPDPEAG